MTKFYVQGILGSEAHRMRPVLEWTQDRLAEFDLSRVDEVKFYVTKIAGSSTGRCYYPRRKAKYSREFVRGYRISCGIALGRELWPRVEFLNVGTETVTGIQSLEGLLSFDAQQRADAARGWAYIRERTVFQDWKEELAWLAGHEAFHFLRHSKQIPGRNSETEANRHGLEWLKAWQEA